jgi:hypothetical protein
MIGKLRCVGKITADQEQVARDVQEAWVVYCAELSLNTGRSCLDIGPVGYDGGDGNPAAIKRWRAVTGKLNTWQYGALVHTVCQDNPPGNLRLLVDALNVLLSEKRY